jgi:hypothetical protein
MLPFLQSKTPLYLFSTFLNMCVPTLDMIGHRNYSFASAVEEEMIECKRSAHADFRLVVEMEYRHLSEH